MKALVIALVTALLVALGVAALTEPASSAVGNVTVAGQTHIVDGINIYRSTNFLVEYTPARGATTGTNTYGYEAAVVNGTVTTVADGVGNMAIPSNGVVLSGHGTSRTWLRTYAKVGATVVLPGETPPSSSSAPPTTTAPVTTTAPPPSGTALLPDLGVRTLRQFTIVNTGGRKLLKFPGVTSNVGKGPFEINGTRSSSTSTDWSLVQTIFRSDGTKSTRPVTGTTFYFAGDGHSHWHVRDLDAYELFNGGGQKLRDGEKHGFCFEDNTSYRDWPGRVAGSPASPVYTHTTVCGVNQPAATSVKQGLSVGWGDTYPASLPDQAIDITGLADGTYQVRITADWANWFQEANESNNAASAMIRITGNTVTLISANDGL